MIAEIVSATDGAEAVAPLDVHQRYTQRDGGFSAMPVNGKDGKLHAGKHEEEEFLQRAPNRSGERRHGKGVGAKRQGRCAAAFTARDAPVLRTGKDRPKW